MDLVCLIVVLSFIRNVWRIPKSTILSHMLHKSILHFSYNSKWKKNKCSTHHIPQKHEPNFFYNICFYYEIALDNLRPTNCTFLLKIPSSRRCGIKLGKKAVWGCGPILALTRVFFKAETRVLTPEWNAIYDAITKTPLRKRSERNEDNYLLAP